MDKGLLSLGFLIAKISSFLKKFWLVFFYLEDVTVTTVATGVAVVAVLELLVVVAPLIIPFTAFTTVVVMLVLPDVVVLVGMVVGMAS